MLIVVRHGRTTDNAAGLLLGRADPDLDAEGEHEARAVAEWIGPVDRVISSPLLRSRRTAAAFDGDVEIDDRWIELDYGAFDRRPVAEVPAEVWSRWRTDPDFAPPGGESMGALHRRVAAACEELAPSAADADIVVVTHVSPIKAVASWVLGGVPEAGFRMRVSQPSVSRVSVGRHGPVLHSFNEGPPSRPPPARATE